MLPRYDPEARIWYGPQTEADVETGAGFGQILFEKLKLNPEHVVQIDGDSGNEMTRADMLMRAIRVIQNLQDEGFNKCDMVTLACANSENLGPLVVGLLFGGLPFNALAANYSVDDMAHMMKITEPALVFCDDSNYDVVRKAIDIASIKQPKVYVFESDRAGINNVETLLKQTNRETEFRPVQIIDPLHEIANITCTSGTTGPMKGVSVSHARYISGLSKANLPNSLQTMFTFSSLFWASGVYCFFASIINDIPKLITRTAFNEDVFFNLMQKYSLSCIFTPPSYANLLLNHPRAKSADWSNVQLWWLGGSNVRDQLRDAIDELLPRGRSFNIFANSELGTIAIDLIKRKPKAAGQIAENICAKIVDDQGSLLKNGEIGELVTKHCYPFSGYYKNPEANAEAIDGEEWLRTGDLAFIDDEGFLFPVDRGKEILKYRNYQIPPGDLEHIIAGIDGVKEVCVIGLPDIDESSDLAAAVVVKKSGSKLTGPELVEIVNGQVVDYKKLRGGVFFVDQLPLSPAGKVLRRKLKEIIMKRISRE
ncbi:uncharacterized protein LOC129755533 [Uranotaenia lowii]|uniref:uncharacterized protein LOC129755533 n=1 Tax=Uranotaenia lowii TaxID=190385 RepID=UPI00247A83BA|nr:uncharacterized protein LOC129755533 [Uranotaenia lowii]